MSALLLLGAACLVLGACGDDDPAATDDTPPLPFQSGDEFLKVQVDDDEYRPIFIRGINLGVGVPGTKAGELAASYDDYRRWFEQMRQMGFNTLRIYTLHFPRFYEALADHNADHPDDPLYVLHGIWLDEDNPGDDLLDLEEIFDQGIDEVVDCVHGDCSIDHRFGRAHGDYEVDISRWVMGWIIGREVHPDEVKAANEAHPDLTSFEGQHFAIDDASAVEVWFTERLERLVRRGLERYGTTRPVSVSSWPTLDPIDHPTERPEFSEEDVASFDPTQIELLDAPGGLFATYHAYPYYPDYIVEDPDYRQFEDDQGPNSYLGYLTRLRSHYEGMPLFIGEFGVPSSWGNAHWGYLNMNHGGHDEVEQGEVNARLMRTIHDTSTAGGAVFAWIDEWWKPTWITDPFDFPRQRRPLWHNIVAPEQNFGLVAFDVEPPTFEPAPTMDLASPISDIETASDALYFHVRLHLDAPLDELAVLGLDTTRADLGESILVDDTPTTRRHEFALMIDGTREADLYVTEAYDLFGLSLDMLTPEQQLRSIATDGAPWLLVQWLNGQARESEDGELFFERTVQNIGELTIRHADDAPSSHDAVVVHDDHIDIRLPWSLLHFTDPTQNQVLHNDPDEPQLQTMLSEGIGLTVTYDQDEVAVTDRVPLPTWDRAPTTTERIKDGAQPFSEALQEMPYWVD